MVGKRIRELRKHRKLSLKALSDMIPLSVSFLSDIENGRSNPSIKRLEEIALALETNVAYLIEGDNTALAEFKDNLPNDSTLAEILSCLNNFDSWTDYDKNELLMYLKAKEAIRSYKR